MIYCCNSIYSSESYNPSLAKLGKHVDFVTLLLFHLKGSQSWTDGNWKPMNTSSSCSLLFSRKGSIGQLFLSSISETFYLYVDKTNNQIFKILTYLYLAATLYTENWLSLNWKLLGSCHRSLFRLTEIASIEIYYYVCLLLLS